MPNASSARPWRCDGGRGVELRGSEHLARHPPNPPQMPDGSAWPWCGVQKFKVQKARSSEARSSEGSAGRKSVNEFKNGKSACFLFGGCRKPLCALPSRRRKGRDGDPRLAPNGPGGGKFPPVTKPYDKLNGRAVFFFFSFLLLTYNMNFCLL